MSCISASLPTALDTIYQGCRSVQSIATRTSNEGTLVDLHFRCAQCAKDAMSSEQLMQARDTLAGLQPLMGSVDAAPLNLILNMSNAINSRVHSEEHSLPPARMGLRGINMVPCLCSTTHAHICIIV